MTSKQTLTWIQALRGFAAILVVLFHSSANFEINSGTLFLNGLFNFGYAGVDIFFVLSGFIITYSVYKDNCPNINKTFFLRRVIRVVPLYYLVTILVIPLYLMVPSLSGTYQNDPLVIIKSFLFLPQEQYPVLMVGWTLNHELKFYLLFGLLLLIKPSWSKLVTITVLLISLVNTLHVVPIDNIYFDFVFSQYNLEFFLGFIAARLFLNHSIDGFYKHLIIAGSFMFVIFGLLDNGFNLNEYRVLIYGVPSMLLIIGLAIFEKSTSKRTSGLLLHLGEASYSTYLLHFYVLVVIGKAATYFNDSPMLLLGIEILILILVLIACSVFYRIIEKPLLNSFKSVINKKTIKSVAMQQSGFN